MLIIIIIVSTFILSSIAMFEYVFVVLHVQFSFMQVFVTLQKIACLLVCFLTYLLSCLLTLLTQ